MGSKQGEKRSYISNEAGSIQLETAGGPFLLIVAGLMLDAVTVGCASPPLLAPCLAQGSGSEGGTWRSERDPQDRRVYSEAWKGAKGRGDGCAGKGVVVVENALGTPICTPAPSQKVPR